MSRDVRFFEEVPVWDLAKSRLFTADFLRWHFMWESYGIHERANYAELGRKLNLSDEFVRSVLNGTREPSRAFLEATGYERVVLYRKKTALVTPTPENPNV